MLVDIGLVAEPMVAVFDHLGVGNDTLRRLDNEIVELSRAHFVFDDDDLAGGLIDRRLANSVGENVPRFLVRPVRPAVGVALRDLRNERIGDALAFRDIEGNERPRPRSLLDRREVVGVEAYTDDAPFSGRGDDEIFDRSANADVHLAQERIKGTEVAGEIGG